MGVFSFLKLETDGAVWSSLEGLISSWLSEKGPILIEHC